jgi:hypothetical protein
MVADAIGSLGIMKLLKVPVFTQEIPIIGSAFASKLAKRISQQKPASSMKK